MGPQITPSLAETMRSCAKDLGTWCCPIVARIRATVWGRGSQEARPEDLWNSRNGREA